MKYEKIYMISRTNKKADNTDYIDYYKAENGMVIECAELLNMSNSRFYRIFENEKAYLLNRTGRALRSFEYLKDAKRFVENM